MKLDPKFLAILERANDKAIWQCIKERRGTEGLMEEIQQEIDKWISDRAKEMIDQKQDIESSAESMIRFVRSEMASRDDNVKRRFALDRIKELSMGDKNLAFVATRILDDEYDEESEQKLWDGLEPS